MSLNIPGQHQALSADLGSITRLPPPVMIDEWQLEPPVWDRVRTAVDDHPGGGQFLLAGSAGVPPGVRIHSGAGRIVSLMMRPLSIVERGLIDPTVSIRELLSGQQPNISGRSALTLTDYVDEILWSDFPGIRLLPDRPRDVQLDSYIARIVEKELPDSGVNVRRPHAMREPGLPLTVRQQPPTPHMPRSCTRLPRGKTANPPEPRW
ncbi:MAG: hypothetical protein ACRCTR_07820 [Actinomycetota bacterium]